MQYDADEALWFNFRVERKRWRTVLVHGDHEALVDDDHEDGPPLYGCCDYETRTVYVNASVSLRNIHDTTLHEIGHAAIDADTLSHVRAFDLSRDIEEALIRGVTPILCRVARPRWPAFPPEARALIRVARRKAHR